MINILADKDKGSLEMRGSIQTVTEGVKPMTKAKINGIDCRVYEFKMINGNYYLTVSFPDLYDMKFDVVAELVELSI